MTQQTVSNLMSGVMPALADSGLLVSSCTIQSLSSALNAIGQPNLRTYTNVTGLVAIPCMVSVLGYAQPAVEETKRPEYTEEHRERHCLLNDYYPAITDKMRAVVGGTAYDILAVQHDSQGIMTRLHLRRVDF